MNPSFECEPAILLLSHAVIMQQGIFPDYRLQSW